MDKRNKYINYVIDNIFDTQIKFIGDEVIFYFCNINDGFTQIPVSVFFSENSSWNKFDWNDYKEYDDSFEGDFIRLLKNYGIDEDEVDIIEDMFHRLIDRIKDKISNNSLNESEDKRDKFIEVIVDDLISKSRIDYDEMVIYQPSGFYLSFRDLDSRIRDNRINAPTSMKDYIRHYYQLNNEYTFRVFKLYLVTLKDKITNKGNINESIEDKKSRFIEYIINDLVNDTKIDYDERVLYVPSLQNNEIFFSFFRFSLSFFSTPNPFSDYCKERYGLTEDEVNYIWDRYNQTIKDKITDN